jgi:hypothetical protein
VVGGDQGLTDDVERYTRLRNEQRIELRQPLRPLLTPVPLESASPAPLALALLSGDVAVEKERASGLITVLAGDSEMRRRSSGTDTTRRERGEQSPNIARVASRPSVLWHHPGITFASMSARIGDVRGGASLCVAMRSHAGLFSNIGETGFEPATARPPAECATRLRHSTWLNYILTDSSAAVAQR